MPTRRMPRIAALVAAAMLLAGCAADVGPAEGDPAVPAEVAERIDAVDVAVAEWQAAGDLETAHRAAEEARNLIEGPGGPHYGDVDGDGTIGGEVEMGLLPGVDAQPGHPQRVVGWATLTLGSDSLDEAHEYAGHARLHVDISRAAYESCPG